MSFEWPETMPAGGRLSTKESDTAWQTGICRVMDPTMSCPQTLQISLFFDGTNNNDSNDSPWPDSIKHANTNADTDGNPWRDSKRHAHTNVARLFNAALFEPGKGIFRYYIPGVGTPFPKIGEYLYSTDGKVFATGFGPRCVWAYTRVLNAVYSSIASDKTRPLIWDDPEAKQLCDAGGRGNMDGFSQYLHRLGVAHKRAVDAGAWPRTIKQIWINVFGFSRGAAGARAFVHKLVNEWAPGGVLGDQTGKYALPYQVNFMGLFDTVASVGLPGSVRTVLDLPIFDGHWGKFAGHGGLAIPPQVRFCVHAFSIHEQRMSFPLDSIREGDSYPGDCRHEIAYPGVHSDIGGGYTPGEQGKACDDNGAGDDSRKLSQIPLHDMYIAALKYGVPLMRGSTILQTPRVVDDFALHPDTIAAFNGWLDTVDRNGSRDIGSAMRFGMGQLLSWRTLRARPDGDYVTEQRFFKRAHEDALTPHLALERFAQACKTDPQLHKLDTQLHQAYTDKAKAAREHYPEKVPSVDAANQAIVDIQLQQRIRKEALCGEVAHPHAPPGPLPNSARPGEDITDVVTNDKTDLRQGAEEMRLLLGYLYPAQRELWQVRATVPAGPLRDDHFAAQAPVLWVPHDQPRSDSPRVTLVERKRIPHHSLRTIDDDYNVADDVVVSPLKPATGFLRQSTSPEAVQALRTGAKAAVDLFDNYVHDSRCWFRVPYFHEYAPGGYFWPRVVFVGRSNRLPWLGFDPLAVAMIQTEPAETELA